MRKILVPKNVSFSGRSKRGTQSRGTKAFVPAGTRLPSELFSYEKWQHLRKLARKSPYFIKRVSNRNRTIRALLQAHGVRVEKIIEDLKNGTCLFKREGFELGSKAGIRMFQKHHDHALAQIKELFAKLVVLEVTHHHLHPGNLAITPSGHIILLDLGAATVAGNAKRAISNNQLRKRISVETNFFLDRLIEYYRSRISPITDPKELKERWFNEIRTRQIAFATQLESKTAKKAVFPSTL